MLQDRIIMERKIIRFDEGFRHVRDHGIRPFLEGIEQKRHSDKQFASHIFVKIYE